MKTKIILSALFLYLATSCFAATTYTSRADFTNAVSSYPIQILTNYDNFPDGEYVNYLDKMSCSVSGLGSDGATPVYMNLMTTNSFPASSRMNAMGVDISDHQFLSGNSDSITFNFSSPINAFALNLIGNPSPTGEPAVPFWKMHVYTTAGFDAYSTTDPQYTLSAGNDVYFLGVVSPEESFTQLTVYPDNDPAAAFSFNIDDVVYGTNPKQVSISDVKSEPMGTQVMLTGVPVERHHVINFNSRYYLESPSRDTGIAVIGELGAARNDAVTFIGTMTSMNNELAINVDWPISVENYGTAVPSLGMGTLSLGGGVAKGFQVGIPGSIGPNNVGLDVTIWGKITDINNDYNPYYNNSWIIVDDGAGRPSGEGTAKGVKVNGAINAGSRSIGDFVVIRGSSSIWTSMIGQPFPLVRVAEPGDITP